jgi:hypothetical protein
MDERKSPGNTQSGVTGASIESAQKIAGSGGAGRLMLIIGCPAK